MTVHDVQIQRANIISRRPFADVLASIEFALGHPEMLMFRRDMVVAQTDAALARIVENAIGLMEFVRFNLGDIVRKTTPNSSAKILRIVAGNPLVMKEMVRFVPDAGSYAPVTILIDERPDGPHLSYDRVESLLAPYGNPEAQRVARELDAKVERMLTAAAE